MRAFIFTITVCLTLFSAASENSLIILTTNQIKNTSVKLATFTVEKQKRGWNVLVATEDQYGGAGLSGKDKVLQIRDWLKTVSPDYRYLLLIGDPDADKNGIPMMITWPLHEYPDTSETGGITNIPIPTDMLYVNLTGNWDLNGNGKFGETGLDDGPGGINFQPDFIAGRIPVYDSAELLDTILDKAITYMNTASSDAGYRNTFLFPAGFYFFRGLSQMGDWDSAGLGEWAIHNFLATSARPLSITTMYEEEGFEHSIYPSTLPLNKENLIAEWRKTAGVIFWGGHTFYNRILRLVWVDDYNHNDLAEMNEITMPELFNAKDAPQVVTDKPGFLFSPNCNAGIVDLQGNFAESLLSTALVGLMAATAPSTPSYMNWDCYDCDWDTSSYGSDTAGIFSLQALVEGGTPAAGLLQSKETYGEDASALTYANKMMFNWYGDPTLTLDASSDDILPDSEPSPDTDETPDTDTGSSKGGCSIIIPGYQNP